MIKRTLGLCVAAGLSLLGVSPSPAVELNVGDVAPEFQLTGSDGKTYKLADFRDKQAVVIAWFPKAFTGG